MTHANPPQPNPPTTPPPAPPTIDLRLERAVRTDAPASPRVCQVAAMFGLGVDQSRTLAIVPPTNLRLAPAKLIFITGASGGGKTTLLRLIADRLANHQDPRRRDARGLNRPPDPATRAGPRVNVLDFDALALEGVVGGADAADRRPNDPAIVEAIGGTLEQATRWLALAGLNDAFVMLRRPSELSDGQRYRYALARAIAAVERSDAEAPVDLHVVLADEFAATLDRMTARVIARNVRKWVSRAGSADAAAAAADSADAAGAFGDGRGGGVCFIAATTHDDLLEALEPDTLIVQRPGEAMEVFER